VPHRPAARIRPLGFTTRDAIDQTARRLGFTDAGRGRAGPPAVVSPPDDPTRELLAPRRIGAPAPGVAVPGEAAGRAAGWKTVLAVSATLGVLLAAALALASGWMGGHRAADSAADSATPAPAVGAQAPAAAAPPSPSPDTAPAPAAASRAPGAVPAASMQEMLQAPRAADWRVWRFAANPSVLVIEFPSLVEQGLAMNRLAAMFEKRHAPRDRLISDSELAALLQRSGDSIASFYQGHDYPADRVAQFFTLAAAAPALLNPQERRLQALLADAGVISPAGPGGPGGFSAAGRQAVLSFTAEQPDDPSTLADEAIDATRRAAVLQHELSHGEYFTNPQYRAHSQAFWSRRLSAPERKLWRQYLAGLDYNADDEDLMANEAQAMLMHTPDARAFNAGALGVDDPALASMRSRFRIGEPAHGLSPRGR
jgi:hypothetical protein